MENTIFCFALVVNGTSASSSSFMSCFVDLEPDLIFLPCPFHASSDSGKYFVAAVVLSSGHDA